MINNMIFKYIKKINMQLKTLLEKELKQYKINFNSFSVLQILYNKGTDNVSSICEQLIIKNSSMTYVIKGLEKNDYLSRVVCENDKRNFNLNLTNKGFILMDELIVLYNKTIDSLLLNLSSNEKIKLKEILNKIS